MSLESRLAAIITLLSSSALRGATAAKTAALRAHLESARFAAADLPLPLRQALDQTLAGWEAVECHPASVSVDCRALVAAGPALH
ncbi:hypothetical protein [Azoarcus olearius]|uniref:Hypothetical secreted protein n=1 Tax=Azoarcus sp. (strain BH72) TaxID=418699 RepID=A1K834_AZOSB|nr:hypothetical protein [Azoarcus olearius]CAL94989.1 hypothetical secreted protein [Azoarcus olearius]